MMNPNWLNIQQGLAAEFVQDLMANSSSSEDSIEAFAQHLSQQLAEALKRGDPQIIKTVILQMNCLKALHGLLIHNSYWEELLAKVEFILKIGALFLL